MSETQSGQRELVKFVHDLGKKQCELQNTKIEVRNDSNQVVLIPEGMEIKDLSGYVPENPARKEVNLLLYDPKSFICYVKEQKNDATRIFAKINEPPYNFMAIIDHHGVSGQSADWCLHQVTLQLKLTDQFKVWKESDNNFFPQDEFAEFLKDNRLDIIEPNNAEILTMTMGLEANIKSRVLSKLPTNEGTELAFSEEVNTSVNGEKITVPQNIKLKIPVFLGGEAFEINADFKMRTREGKIWFAYRLLGIDKLIRDTVTDMAKKIEKESKVPVYI